MTDEIRPGYYQDAEGNWHSDRRSGKDRRGVRGDWSQDERRGLFRRQADREFYDREHKKAIEEALKDFAEEHGGRL
ncbi:MAG TPA: hypothetical protein PKI11_14100 [Candidatus Hydrogenedentes bacterium]|nr:hypothetical protein [Candidatus Hydrogenedentota bacterium]